MAEYNRNGYIIALSEESFISLTLSALEAYSVAHMNIKKNPNTRLETYGSIFGQEIQLKDGRTLFRVEMATPDTSSKQAQNSVQFNEEAISLKVNTVSSFWPHLEYLGDFHSHPYDTYQIVRSQSGYYMSPGDVNSLQANWDFWASLNYRVGLVVTVSAMKRSGRNAARWIKNKNRWNCVEFTMGNIRCWISAACAYDNGNGGAFTADDDATVELHIPALTGMQWEHTPYGRYKNNSFTPR